jgi:hypothetical protein
MWQGGCVLAVISCARRCLFVARLLAAVAQCFGMSWSGFVARCVRSWLILALFVYACCRVLVLDQGLLIENGEPHELLQKEAGIFSGMVEQTGSSSSAYLRDVAREASYTRAAARSVASGTALHLHRLREQQDSMVSGRPAPAGLAGEAVSEEESEEGQQQHGGDGAAGAGRFNRNRSELGLNRYAAQVGGSLWVLGSVTGRVIWLLWCGGWVGEWEGGQAVPEQIRCTGGWGVCNIL